MIGYNIYLFGTNADTSGTFPTDYTMFHVLGLDYEPRFIKAGERGEHGGYRRPKGLEKVFTLNFYPEALTDYYSNVDSLFELFSKKHVYFNCGTHPGELTTSSSVIEIVATGTSIEHDYPNGNKSIDFEVAIYE